MQAFAVFKVRLGWMAIVGSEDGIERIYLPEMDEPGLRRRILSGFPAAREGAPFLRQAEKELQEYFAGRRTRFDFPLDLSQATPFQRKVYRVMKEIPFGEIHSYGWLAREIGNPQALRAVGGANGKNRWPIVIPCHRIVGSCGSLTGFSAPGGLGLKAGLLDLEGIPVRGQRVELDEKERRRKPGGKGNN
jgi:methylated-DNA-[protein]-cysteine S-methyltransferase